MQDFEDQADFFAFDYVFPTQLIVCVFFFFNDAVMGTVRLSTLMFFL